MSGTYTGDCSAARFFQIDAFGSGCDIQYTGGSMSGISSAIPAPGINGGTVSGSWVIPTVSASCAGKTVSPTAAAMRDSAPGPSSNPIGGIVTPSGSSFTFAPLCGNGIVNPGEQCELPSTSNNNYCSQSTSTCDYSSKRYGTRDSLGNCDGACGCTLDAFSYGSPNDAAYCSNCNHCSDGAQNCAETGVDIGGSCPACINGQTDSQPCDYCSGANICTGTKIRTCSGGTWGGWGACSGGTCAACPTTSCPADYCSGTTYYDYPSTCQQTCSGTSCQSCTCTATQIPNDPRCITTYTGTFPENGLPTGTSWGVTVAGIRHASTSPSQTVTGLSGSNVYSYDSSISALGTTYYCSANCVGTVTASSPMAPAASYSQQATLSMTFSGTLSYSTGSSVKNSLIKVTLTNTTLGEVSATGQTDGSGHFSVIVGNVPASMATTGFDMSIYVAGDIEAIYQCRYSRATGACA